MSDVKPRRIRAWKLFAGIALALALILSFVAYRISTVADQRWEGMRAQVLQILKEDLERPAARQVLRGDPVAGNAWDDYDQALSAAAAIPPMDHMALNSYVYRSRRYFPYPDRPRPALETLLAAHAPALAPLRKGATRAEAKILYRRLDGTRLKTPRFSGIGALGTLARLQARDLAQRERGREAAELLLDVAQFAGDLSGGTRATGKYYWEGILTYVLEELTPLVLSNRLGDEDLLEVERELSVLDRAFLSGGQFESTDVMVLGFDFLESDNLFEDLRGGHNDVRVWSGWRFALSDRLMAEDTFQEAHRIARKHESLRESPWAEVLRFQVQHEERTRTDPNALTRSEVPIYDAGVPVRRSRASLRLLRIAAHYRATGEFLELEDPFGTMLRHGENGCRLKIWSVGRDGVDDGGMTGNWVKGDIVLELDR